jgi:hypothetical protein
MADNGEAGLKTKMGFFKSNPNPYQKSALANHNAILRCRGYRYLR